MSEGHAHHSDHGHAHHGQGHAHAHGGHHGHSHGGHHGHSHGGHHGHSHGGLPVHSRAGERAGDRRRLWLALAVTAGIMVAEAAGGVISNSRALLSDAGHMLSDVMAMSLSLLALHFATRPADQKRTYGYYRLEILSALANGAVLILLSIYLLSQVYGRLTGPPVEIRTSVMLPVAALGLVSNLVGLAILHGASSLNTRGAYLHVLSDTLSSLGVLVGGVVIRYTGLSIIDPILAAVIALLIIWSAVRLVRDAADILLEAVPAGLDLSKVQGAIEQVPGVCHVHDFHIWSITSGHYALSGHVVVTPGSISGIDDNDRLLQIIKERLQRDFQIEHSTLQLESEAYEHLGEEACAPRRACDHLADTLPAVPQPATGPTGG